MGWVYLDDKFPDHEKVQLAGGDAGWLFVCGLAYCNRNVTGGRIPKPTVRQLSDRRGPLNLAARLVKVGLWEDEGDWYRVHGYDDWQRSAVAEHEARVEKAKRAADARWKKQRAATSNAQASAEHEPEQCLTDASRAGSPSPSPIPLVNLSINSHGSDPDSRIDELEVERLTRTWASVLKAKGANPPMDAVKASVRESLRMADARVVAERIGWISEFTGRPRAASYLTSTVKNYLRDHGQEVSA